MGEFESVIWVKNSWYRCGLTLVTLHVLSIQAATPSIEEFVGEANNLFKMNIKIEYSSDPMCMEYTKNNILFLCSAGAKDYESNTRLGYLFLVAHEYSHNLILSDNGYEINSAYYSEVQKLLKLNDSYSELKDRIYGAIAHSNVDMLAAKILFFFGLPNYITEEFEIMKIRAKDLFGKLIDKEVDPAKKRQLQKMLKEVLFAIPYRSDFATLEYNHDVAWKHYQPVSVYCDDKQTLLLGTLSALGINGSSLNFAQLELGGRKCVGSSFRLAAETYDHWYSNFGH